MHVARGVDGTAVFHGALRVDDDITVGDDLNVGGSKNFVIDHPLDPDHMTLRHSCVESWERVNMYDGIAELGEEGRAHVALPDWFEALNRDVRYQLTAIRAPMPDLHVAGELKDNGFTIAGGIPFARVSWQLTGIRQDRYALENPFRIVERKDERNSHGD